MFHSREPGVLGNFRGRIKGAKYRFPLQDGTWDFLGDAVAGKGLILRQRGIQVVFLELRRDSQVTTGKSVFLLCWPTKSNLPFNLLGRAGGCSRVTAGPKRPHLGVCLGPNVPLKGRQGYRDPFLSDLVGQALSPGEAKDSALLSSLDRDLLEPTEWPKGIEASCVTWREDSRLICMPCS